jgi:hypothetical protein
MAGQRSLTFRIGVLGGGVLIARIREEGFVMILTRVLGLLSHPDPE